jgi:glycosyltransferase involved in cell wall biosynthesis
LEIDVVRGAEGCELRWVGKNRPGFLPGAHDMKKGCQHIEHFSVAKKTLFLSFFTAFPPSGGASAVTFQLASHWPGERTLVQVGSADESSEIVSAGFRVKNLPSQIGSGRWSKLTQVPHWVRRMKEIAWDIQPDWIVLEGASWVAYHWYLIRKLRRSHPSAMIVYHAHNVEADLRKQKHSLPVAIASRWFEGRIIAIADVTTAVSSVDQQRFKSLYGVKSELLPNGVDVAWLSSGSEAAANQLRAYYNIPLENVLFMGAYDYKPNRDGLDFLITRVFPELLRRRPQAKLVVIGGHVPYERPWLINPGLVPAEELRLFMKLATVSVVPIFSGSGTRLKAIESLASGVPVVATAKGVEGLPLQAGVDFLLAQTAGDFAVAIEDCLADPVGSRERFEPEMKMIRETFDWPSLVSRFINGNA